MIDALHTLFQQAAAQGQSVFAATGDTGSEDCYDGTTNPPSETLQVDNPADDPFVTGVGGTSLEQPGVEPVWNDCDGTRRRLRARSAAAMPVAADSRTSSSDRVGKPVAANATCSTCREVPDISANCRRRRDLLRLRRPGPGNWWPRSAARASPRRCSPGSPPTSPRAAKAVALGNFAPKLDALAAKHVYGSALTDVTTGINWPQHHHRDPGQQRPHPHPRRDVQDRRTASTSRPDLGVPIAAGLACPRITSMTPNHGFAGTHVTLHGVGLEQATIKFGIEDRQRVCRPVRSRRS